MKKIIYASFLLIVFGCASAKLATPMQTDVDRVQSKFPAYTLNELSQGKTLFETHCDNCHKLKNPSSQTEEKWREIVPIMAKKANKKYPNSVDAAAQDKILKYLITMGPSKSSK